MLLLKLFVAVVGVQFQNMKRVANRFYISSECAVMVSQVETDNGVA